MLEIVATGRFKKDLKTALRRGQNMELLNDVVEQLAAGKTLAPKHRDHVLTGDYGGFRECHIAPDWLLIYQVRDKELILLLSRTGSHSDLFND